MFKKVIITSASLIWLGSAACSHSPEQTEALENELNSSGEPALDFSLGSESDIESPIFVEGQKHRYSKAFELPATEEDEADKKSEN